MGEKAFTCFCLGEMKKISIAAIVPVYNTEKYVAECIESIIHQSVDFDEVIIIDDCSEDNSYLICEGYLENNPNIRLYQKKHGGLGAARNYGFRKVTSDYVVFVDSDDIICPSMVEKLKEIISDSELDLLYYDAESFISGKVKEVYDYKREIRDLLGEKVEGAKFFEMLYPESYYPSACLNVYSISFLKKNDLLFPEGVLFEDNYFSLCTVMSAQKVGYIHRAFYKRRIRPCSIMTSNESELKITDVCKIACLIFDYIKRIKPSIAIKQYYCDLCFEIIKRYMEFRGSCTEASLKNLVLVLNDMINRFWVLCNDTCGRLSEWNVGFAYRAYMIAELENECKELNSYPDEMIKEVVVKKIRDILFSFPFNDERYRIIIYGIGKHTEGFLDAYETCVGEIKADLIYVVSSNANVCFRGKTVHNLSEMKNSKSIFISSFKFRKNMKENAIRNCNGTIMDIYGSGIYCDLFSRHDVLRKLGLIS